MTTTVTERYRALAALYASVELASFVLLIGGVWVAALGWRPGAWMMVVGLLAKLLNDLWLGALAYREVMARPWPKVAPLDDEDDEWGIPAGSYSSAAPRTAHEA